MTEELSNPKTREAYAALIEREREEYLLRATAGLLNWDQETNLPTGGVAFRSKQRAVMSRLIHQRFTDPRKDELLSICEADDELMAADGPAVNVRELRRLHDRGTRLPEDLVGEIAEASSQARAAWAVAKEADEFSTFGPHLDRVIDLLRRSAECYGWSDDGEPWDAIAEGREPGCTAAGTRALSADLRPRLVALVERLADAPARLSDAIDHLRLPVAAQDAFIRKVVGRLGFDFERGRLDTSAHPFCSGAHPGDVRMTTRFSEDGFFFALQSSMHETGHAIYNQGLPPEHTGTPLGWPVSAAIHESQSRMWENHVGKSAPFWRWCTTQMHVELGEAVSHLSFDDLYGGMNRVRPTPFRRTADEATYNLQILVRFELEVAMMRGDLAADDVPAAWDAKIKEYLGVDVPEGVVGCLEDMHWSIGLIGYFPTYTLGNLYAAQFFEAARADIPEMDDQFAQGEFGPLRTWLGEKIHRQGRRYGAAELCLEVTGEPLSAEPLMRHFESKFEPLYGV